MVENGLRSGRRKFIAGAAALAAGAPWIARGAGEQVLVRTSGGSFQAAQDTAIFKPFTAATGIKVIPVPLSTGKLREMLENGRIPVDAQFLVETHQIAVDRAGFLDAIDYDAMRFTNPADIEPAVKKPSMVGAMSLSTVLVYNKEVFAARPPRSWADFWDVRAFPGSRSLPDIKSGFVELEFALLADGVTPAKLYPLDVDRALRSLTRIRRNVTGFWETGTEAMQLMERRDAVLGALWNGRAQDLIDRGAPIALEWNQAKRHNVYWSVLKGAPNGGNAQRFLDFALQPKVQAHLAQLSHYGPTNRQAARHIAPDVAAKLPTAPDHVRASFDEDARWWLANLPRVTERWNAWLSQAA
jgi:putative spermidine/putrescine transport system substrate-binding protein